MAFTYGIEIINNNFNLAGFRDISNYNAKTAVLCVKQDIPGIYKLGSVFVHENENWNGLPDTINYGTSTFSIAISLSSSIHYDSSGSIWVSGNQMYKYSNGKWQVLFVDDSNKAWRNYQQFCVDKFNNIWVATQVYHDNDTLAQYSELLKYDGDKFVTVLKFDMPFSFARRGPSALSNDISSLPDGRIIAHRNFNIHEEDFQNGNKEDLYFINQDLSYQRIKLQTPSGSEFNDYTHVISSIFSENTNKIWFSLNYMNLSDANQTTCCSGLELFENSIWSPFDDKYGFDIVPAYPKVVSRAIYRMLKLDAEYYLILSENMLYKFSKEYKLVRKPWLEVFNNPCKFIIINSKWKESDVQDYLRHLYDSTSGNGEIGSLILQDNGELWLQMGSGILIFNKDILAGIDYHSDEISSALYPNPSTDMLKIKNQENFIKYQVINVLGIAIKEGNLIDNQINVADLPEGLYFIKLYTNGSYIKVENFIKN